MNQQIWASPMGFLRLLALVGIFAVGAWLLLTARRRGEGNAPHCLMCGYNLTGLSSDHCPECGIELKPDMRSCGPPSEMRWGRFLAGSLIVATLFIEILWNYFAGPAPAAHWFGNL